MQGNEKHIISLKCSRITQSCNQSSIGKLISDYLDNDLVIYQEKVILWLQHIKCENFMLFFVMNDRKVKIIQVLDCDITFSSGNNKGHFPLLSGDGYK